MRNYKVVGIDLAKKKYHIAALDEGGHVSFKKKMLRKDFFEQVVMLFPDKETFAMEACGGSHYVGQQLRALGHEVVILKAKDVKAYAKARQKNDLNDAIGICKAACDPELKPVTLKTPDQQTVAYLHKCRQNGIQQRIQRSNSLITSLYEFGFVVECGKSKFAQSCKTYVEEAFARGYIAADIKKEMLKDCQEIKDLLIREKELDLAIIARNKRNPTAQLLETIPGIGPINASILSNKPMSSYERPRDFAASLGLVPRQNTTGGTIKLGSITKQGDRYARTMLIQAGRSVVMRHSKPNVPDNALYKFVERLKKAGKGYNVICVAVANKLARVAYACALKQEAFRVIG